MTVRRPSTCTPRAVVNVIYNIYTSNVVLLYDSNGRGGEPGRVWVA